MVAREAEMREATTGNAGLPEAGAQEPSLSWLSIVRLGMVQAALGAIVVLSTSTLNRVMVVELNLAAMLPGVLVGLHYAVQVSRPLMGLRVDLWGRATPLILIGMFMLAASSIAAAASVQVMAWSPLIGMTVSAVAFFGIGVGVSASGTSLLALLARTVSAGRRPAAATITWVMMIVGIIISAATAAQTLDPYSHERLLFVTAMISLTAAVLASLAVLGVEKRAIVTVEDEPEQPDEDRGLISVMMDIWHEKTVRSFAIFVFVSMLAYSAQDLILEPYAGLVFGLSVGESTSLSATQHQGVLLGMIVVGLLGSLPVLRLTMPMVTWTLLGCVLSAAGLALLATAIHWASATNLGQLVFFLGLGNGIFAVGAIGSMFSFARNGIARREGTRVGIWGAAQAIAFALGGVLATSGVDLITLLGGGPTIAYGSIFATEAILFLVAAILALRIMTGQGKAPSGDVSLSKMFSRGIATFEGVAPVGAGNAHKIQERGTL